MAGDVQLTAKITEKIEYKLGVQSITKSGVVPELIKQLKPSCLGSCIKIAIILATIP